MQEQSYGKVSFSGDVFGWISLNQKISENCKFLSSDPIFLNTINTYKINLKNYDHIVYMLDGVVGGCSSVGKYDHNINNTAYSFSETSFGIFGYNLPSAWGVQPFNWTNLDYILSHELGHSLGVQHANSWLCQDGQILYGDCASQEYGNYFDTMGTNSYSLNYNGYYKEQLGWIPREQILSITQPGSYTLNPLENTSLVDILKVARFAKIYIKDTTESPYFIEFRKALGFDLNLNKSDLVRNQNGIFINRIQYNNSPVSELLDMTPTSSYGVGDSTLISSSFRNPMSSFFDPGTGITIGPVLKASDFSVSFNVDLKEPNCTRFKPTILNFSSDTEVVAGSYIGVNFNFKNNDYYGCGQSVFNTSFTLPSGWVIKNQNLDQTLSPNKLAYVYNTVIIPNNIIPGAYTVSVQVVNKSSGQTTTKNFTVLVTEPLAITSISPTYGPTGTIVTIIGTGFNLSKTMVNMGGINAWSDIQTVSVFNGKFLYTIPNIMTTCDNDGKCSSIPAPDGDYKINIYSNNSKTSVGFRIGQKFLQL